MNFMQLLNRYFTFLDKISNVKMFHCKFYNNIFICLFVLKINRNTFRLEAHTKIVTEQRGKEEGKN